MADYFIDAMALEDRRDSFQPVIERLNFAAWAARQKGKMCNAAQLSDSTLKHIAQLEGENCELRAKLQRVLDWLRFAANSEGGIAQEIDLLLLFPSRLEKREE